MRIYNLSTLFILLLVLACSENEGTTFPITVAINDFETTIDENPSTGFSLGTIEASTNQGSLTYSIVEESPRNAIAINSSTGELTVLNKTLFNFETNPTITGIVKVQNGDVSETANITIYLNDVNEQNLQDRLNNGETPCEIYQSDNTLLDELYGLNYQGGLIFYLNTNDCTGMVAAENDQSSEIEWGCEGVNISGAEFSEIGSGLSNTNAIVSECNEMSYAAKICFDLTLENYDDWYLPSKDELNLLYNNLHLKNLGNFENGSNNCCNGWYWSSTEFEDQDNYNSNGYEAVWVQSFREGNNGTQTTYDIGIKSFKNHVRAIRNF